MIVHRNAKPKQKLKPETRHILRPAGMLNSRAQEVNKGKIEQLSQMSYDFDLCVSGTFR